jgi:hypothetical protein
MLEVRGEGRPSVEPGPSERKRALHGVRPVRGDSAACIADAISGASASEPNPGVLLPLYLVVQNPKFAATPRSRVGSSGDGEPSANCNSDH